MNTYFTNFLAHLRSVRGLSECTIENYTSACSIFFEFCDSVDVESLAEVNQQVVTDWIVYLYENGRQPSSINRYVSLLRNYFNWVIAFVPAMLEMENPCAAVKAMKQPKLLPKYIETRILREILDKMPESSFKELRSKAILVVAWHCGLRRSEMLNLKVVDVNFNAKIIRVFGKGRKERFVPFFDECADILQRYLCARAHQLQFASPWLFCTISGDALNRQQFRWIIQRILLPHVPAELAHPHILRHSFATMMMEKGVPIQAISLVMGHASIATTMRYLTINEDFIRSQIGMAFGC